MTGWRDSSRQSRTSTVPISDLSLTGSSLPPVCVIPLTSCSKPLACVIPLTSSSLPLACVAVHPLMCDENNAVFAGAHGGSVQAIGVRVRGCTGSAFVGLAPFMRVRCSESSILDIGSGVSEQICAPTATCVDAPIVDGADALLDSAGVTTATCTCPSPSYPSFGSYPEAILADKLGCVTPKGAESVSLLSNQVLLHSVKDSQLGAPTVWVEITLRLNGTDQKAPPTTWQARVLNLDMQGDQSHWLQLILSNGSIQSADIQAIQIGVSASAAGLTESAEPYERSVVLSVSAQAGVARFSIPVILYVSAQVAVAQSVWGEREAGERCVLALATAASPLRLYPDRESEPVLQLCDADSLPVSHRLDAVVEANGLERSLTLSISRNGAVTDDQGYQFEFNYLGLGRYGVRVVLHERGSYILLVHILTAVHDGSSRSEAVSPLALDAVCEAGMMPMGAYDCGCPPGRRFEPSPAIGYQCPLCSTGSARSSVGHQCDSCEAGTHQPEEGSTGCRGCLSGTIQPATSQTKCIDCTYPMSSASSSTHCDVCAIGLYQRSLSSPPSSTNCRDCLPGARCLHINTTLSSLVVDRGFWRHSKGTDEISECDADGPWSPCVGGAAAGSGGDAYCHVDHRGPRCQLCSDPHSYFRGARCHRCGDIVGLTSVAAAVVAVVLLAGVALVFQSRRSRLPKQKLLRKTVKLCHRAVALWHSARSELRAC